MDSINLMCSYGFEPEIIDHYLLHCRLFSDLRIGVFAMNQSLKNVADEQLVNVLLYGSQKFTFSANLKILSHTFKFLKVIKCFDSLLF